MGKEGVPSGERAGVLRGANLMRAWTWLEASRGAGLRGRGWSVSRTKLRRCLFSLKAHEGLQAEVGHEQMCAYMSTV